MDIYVLQVTYTGEATTFSPVAVIDTFKSLIWTKRYYTNGDFELYLPADNDLLEYLKPRNWLIRDDDSSVMLIENIIIETNAENGNYFIVSGRSLECILDFRIIYPQIQINANDVVQAVKTLIDTNTTGYRIFPSFSVDDQSLSFPAEISKQYTGQNLLTTVTEICRQYAIGFKITLSDSQIILSFYQGTEVDVTFSPEFDNLINSKYVSNVSKYANTAVVAGEGEGNRRRAIVMYDNQPHNGFSRREIFVDAKDISSNDGEIGSTEYNNMLNGRGSEKLAEHRETKIFEAEVEPKMTYEYKKDYNLGDVVTVTNEYGITAKPRIVEIIESWDDSGYSVIPTFEELEVE